MPSVLGYIPSGLRCGNVPNYIELDRYSKITTMVVNNITPTSYLSLMHAYLLSYTRYKSDFTLNASQSKPESWKRYTQAGQ